MEDTTLEAPAISDELDVTSQDTATEDTSLNEDDSAKETSTETETEVTTSDDDSTANDEKETEKTPNWEQSYKELQAEFTKQAQEYAKLRKQEEIKQSVVEPTGGFKPEVLQQAAQQLAIEELNAYRNSIFELDSEVQSEVNTLLNAYQTTGQTKYLAQAKEYYGANFVGQIESQKAIRATQLSNQLETQRKEYQQKAHQEFTAGLKEQAPTAYDYTNKESKFYCKELEEAINGAIGQVGVHDVEQTIKNIESKIIERYKAQAAKFENVQNSTKKLAPPSGATKNNPNSGKSLAEVEDEKELRVALSKYI